VVVTSVVGNDATARGKDKEVVTAHELLAVKTRAGL
jgi:hypothetical protein